MKEEIITIHKCENCGAEYRAKKHSRAAIGWCGSGTPSKYGKLYERSGVAYWCNKSACKREGYRRSYRRFYQGATDAFLDRLIDQAELEKIREN